MSKFNKFTPEGILKTLKDYQILSKKSLSVTEEDVATQVARAKEETARAIEEARVAEAEAKAAASKAATKPENTRAAEAAKVAAAEAAEAEKAAKAAAAAEAAKAAAARAKAEERNAFNKAQNKSIESSKSKQDDLQKKLDNKIELQTIKTIKSKLVNKECVGPFSFKFYDYKDTNYYDNDSLIKKSLKQSIKAFQTNNIKITLHDEKNNEEDDNKIEFYLTDDYLIVTFYVDCEITYPKLDRKIKDIEESLDK